MAQECQPEINMGEGSKQKKKKTTEKEDNNGNGGSLKRKAPEVFNGDRSKSKEFLHQQKIILLYFS